VSRLFLITEYEQNRHQKKEIFKIVIKTTFSYCSFPNKYYRLSWENISGVPHFFCLSCSSAAMWMKGLNEHLLYPFIVCMEERATTASASLRANYFSLSLHEYFPTTTARVQAQHEAIIEEKQPLSPGTLQLLFPL